MHFAILVEDQSGKAMLDILVPKILGLDTEHTFTVYPYKGIGHIPKGLNPKTDPEKRILLDQLPRLLSGFGKAFAGYGDAYPAAVIVVCDLDDRNLLSFRNELKAVLSSVSKAPDTAFCLAIEEGEAWLLGDVPAIKKAFPKAKDVVLTGYNNDSICGTWEVLADALYPGGANSLKAQGYQVAGAEKSRWARQVTPHMDIDNNQSPSFSDFVAALRPSQAAL
jgi:hypothetical protein